MLADQRRRAGLALTSDALENWHRYVLPCFLERARQRIKQSCHDEHQPWPSRSRYVRYTSDQATQLMLQAFNADQTALTPTEPPIPTRPRLTVVDGKAIDPSTPSRARSCSPLVKMETDHQFGVDPMMCRGLGEFNPEVRSIP